jgi:Berberine and berberine like
MLHAQHWASRPAQPRFVILFRQDSRHALLPVLDARRFPKKCPPQFSMTSKVTYQRLPDATRPVVVLAARQQHLAAQAGSEGLDGGTGQHGLAAAADQGLLHKLRGFRRHDGRLSRQLRGANFERLVALKAKYDPKNLFRLNANVPPKIG